MKISIIDSTLLTAVSYESQLTSSLIESFIYFYYLSDADSSYIFCDSFYFDELFGATELTGSSPFLGFLCMLST
jgi:hypothetical protein